MDGCILCLTKLSPNYSSSASISGPGLSFGSWYLTYKTSFSYVGGNVLLTSSTLDQLTWDDLSWYLFEAVGVLRLLAKGSGGFFLIFWFKIEAISAQWSNKCSPSQYSSFWSSYQQNKFFCFIFSMLYLSAKRTRKKHNLGNNEEFRVVDS